MSTFYEKYEPVFLRVCSILGDGWRIDKREANYDHQIKLMNPTLKNYKVTARMDNQRLILVGGAYRGNRYSNSSRCTVAPARGDVGIARDIRRKILIDAGKQIADVTANIEGTQAMRAEREIVIGLLSRLIHVDCSNHYSALCYIRNKFVDGTVNEASTGQFNLALNGINKDTLFKIVGFISTLE